ncbi:uncharacterized protein DNG_00316 [Cephalotrichum gorgonifer]|uniref:PinX1-related protein 1 n=1 Tax=Cephalotrichum gorgonifer TaxID=2041049 RepID=A0AAE8SQR8_9PEZI|nr:uncharacterized protein DNG_00316 [Cephalotrichum gorgonifer]
MAKGRIGKDPNNTRWTKDTTTFGHRILRSHGWTPGSFLGAENAPHAELHSAASASYIRVAMKDDAGGLGFRPGQSSDNDIAGLDEVKGIFDRLNGVVETEAAREARERRKAMAYLGQRLGGIAFISGGFLEQEGWDKVGEMAKAEVVEEEVLVVDDEEAAGKRKAGEEGAEEAPRKKRRRDGSEKADKKARKEERRKRKEKSVESESSPADSSSSSDDDADEASPAPKPSKRQKPSRTSPGAAPETKSERKERREARRARKEERRLRREKKEEKRRERLLKSGGGDAKSKKKRRKSAAEIEAIVTGTSTPVDSDAPARTRTSILGGRHIHHARKVAAKNSAMSNSTVLAQILAI